MGKEKRLKKRDLQRSSASWEGRKTGSLRLDNASWIAPIAQPIELDGGIAPDRQAQVKKYRLLHFLSQDLNGLSLMEKYIQIIQNTRLISEIHVSNENFQNTIRLNYLESLETNRVKFSKILHSDQLDVIRSPNLNL